MFQEAPPTQPENLAASLSPMRQDLVQWFEREAPSLAPAYRAAIQILEISAMPARVHLVSHIVRDIYGKLPEILDGEYRRTNAGEVYPSFVDQVEDHWDQSKGTALHRDNQASTDVAAAGAIAVSVAAARSVDNLLEKHRRLREQPRSADVLARAMYRRFAESGLEAPRRLVDQFKRERDWFTQRAHLAIEMKKMPSDDGLLEHFAAFERALYSLVGQYFTGKTEIDAILQQASHEQVDAAIPWLSAPHHERYFFDKLDNPHWIGPLFQRGFFKDGPEPETIEGGGVRSKVWPQSRYLARMAPLAPEEVAKIFVEIKTTNRIVIRDLIDAFKRLPSAHAVMLVHKVGDAVRDFRMWHQLDDIAEVVARLSQDGYADAGLELVSRAFDVRRDEIDRCRQQDDYGFFEGLGVVIPALASAKPREMITLLINWLVAVIDSKAASRDGDDDLSYIWRPAIEDHEQNRDFNFAAKLAGSLRDALELVIRDNHLALPDALHMLDLNGVTIMKRVRIHLIAEFAELDQDLARRTMMDKAMFIDHRVKHEYARLMGLRFGLLSQEQQTEWLSWVDVGPEAYLPDFFEPDADDTIRRQQAEYWWFRRLHWVRDHLTGERKQFYERMLKEHGQPQLADLNIYSGGERWGHETPFTHEQLAEMDFEAVVSTVSKWRPDPGQPRFDRPSVEGLSDAFAQYVKSDPVTFSGRALHLKKAPAPYVRAFLRTMEEATKEGKAIELAQVLDLCEWVLSRPVAERTSPPDDDGGLVDRDWQWCRDTIADLVGEICKTEDEAKRPRFAFAHRAHIWRVLAPLFDSPATSNVLRDDAEADPRLTDWPLLALNSPRGKAMRALFEYADWVASHVDAQRNDHKALPGGFQHMPEVRTILESQLKRPDDYFTGRAGFGWRLGLLYWLDAQWLREHAARIFDLKVIEQEPSRAYGWAAWNTFLFASRPHIEFYKMLRGQFDYAVKQAAAVEKLPDSREQPFARLAEHLITLYGRGDLGGQPKEAWNADDGLIRRLVTETHVSVRSHAVEFVGMTLQDADDSLPKEVIQRFMYLWERYWVSVGPTDAKRHPTSSVFGYWFSCNVFDPAWSIQQLEMFVAMAPKAEPDNMIMERLVKIAHVDAVRSARVVGSLVDGDDENWRIWSWKDEARAVLSTARDAGGEAKVIADQVIDRLGRRGYVEFGELLKSQKAKPSRS